MPGQAHKGQKPGRKGSNYNSKRGMIPSRKANCTYKRLYFEEKDGEIALQTESETKEHRLITCVDVDPLYKEKRQKAFELANLYGTLDHPNIVKPLAPPISANNIITFETEAPDNNLSWKSYCKKKFDSVGVLRVFRGLALALQYLHQHGIIH